MEYALLQAVFLASIVIPCCLYHVREKIWVLLQQCGLRLQFYFTLQFIVIEAAIRRNIQRSIIHGLTLFGEFGFMLRWFGITIRNYDLCAKYNSCNLYSKPYMIHKFHEHLYKEDYHKNDDHFRSGGQTSIM